MRKIEEKMVLAVRNRKNMTEGNTRVENTANGAIYVFLHGNMIYEVSPLGVASFGLCGWNTPTTRSRLNALGVGICVKKGVVYHNGKPVDIHSWNRV